MSSLTDQLLALSVKERLQIVEILCESLVDEGAAPPIPEWLEPELDRRQAAHKQAPESAIPWEEARERLRRRYG
jgi:putative addiction module component (TIGR02574 family)